MSAEPRFSWTQPCCAPCWDERNPDRPAVTLNGPYAVWEECVYCGDTTNSGIYVREDPATAFHPTLVRDA